ncbi:hypothetical protein QT381_15645 [Galbitalea sp. SE-J8]|nr:hypothetical protein [Galbitalea sp. SE-J8]
MSTTGLKRWRVCLISLSMLMAFASVGTACSVQAPTSSPTPPGASESSESCENALDTDTADNLKSLDWRVDDSFVQRVGPNAGPLSEFVPNGGNLCGWGVPGDDIELAYGYGPIAAVQAESMQEQLGAAGAKSVADVAPGAVTYSQVGGDMGIPGGWAFGSGWWAYSLNNGYAVDGVRVDLLPEIVNAASQN